MSKIIIIVLCVLLGAGFIGFIIFAKESKKQTTSSVAADKPITFSPSGMTKGPSDAPLTLVEFSDFQCPFCAEASPVVEAALAQYEGKIKFVYKHFPLISVHKNGLPAARAAEAAGAQGKFWEMHDMLFERQQDWSNEPNPSSKFEGYAKEMKLDVEKFKTDVKNDDFSKKIEEQRNEGIGAGVTSTPTFFLNGKKVELTALSIDAFKEAFDKELASLGTTSPQEKSTESATTVPAQ